MEYDKNRAIIVKCNGAWLTRNPLLLLAGWNAKGTTLANPNLQPHGGSGPVKQAGSMGGSAGRWGEVGGGGNG